MNILKKSIYKIINLIIGRRQTLKSNNKIKINAVVNIFGQDNNIYQIGIIPWILLWIFLLIIYLLNHSWNWFYPLYSAPISGCIYILYCNYKTWKQKIEIEEYKQEVALIEFVERNANYVILGITALFIASEIISRNNNVDLRGFYFFQILSLLFSVGFVLPLIWKPRKEDNASSLVLLRHWKTVWYTYSIYFFVSSIFALFFTLLGIN